LNHVPSYAPQLLGVVPGIAVAGDTGERHWLEFAALLFWEIVETAIRANGEVIMQRTHDLEPRPDALADDAGGQRLNPGMQMDDCIVRIAVSKYFGESLCASRIPDSSDTCIKSRRIA
jgi:hypothetical protein